MDFTLYVFLKRYISAYDAHDLIIDLRHMLNAIPFEFKKSHSTTQCTFLVNKIVQYSQYDDTTVYVTLFHVSGAFDRVNYVKLSPCLLKSQVCPIILRFLIVFETNQSISIQ